MMEDRGEHAGLQDEPSNYEEERWSNGDSWEQDSTNYSAFQSMQAYVSEKNVWVNHDEAIAWENGFNDNALADVQSRGYDNVREIPDRQFPALGSSDVALEKEPVTTKMQHLKLKVVNLGYKV